MFVRNDNGDAAKEPNIVLCPLRYGMKNAYRGNPDCFSEPPQSGDLEKQKDILPLQHGDTGNRGHCSKMVYLGTMIFYLVGS